MIPRLPSGQSFQYEHGRMPGGDRRPHQRRRQSRNRALGLERQDLGEGLALNGVVIRSAPAGGVRIRFAGMELAEKENLRQFLKYVQETTRASNSESSYLQLLK